MQRTLRTILLGTTLGLGACTTQERPHDAAVPAGQTTCQPEAHNVRVEQEMNGSLRIEGEVNGEAWTYRVHRDSSGTITSEQLVFPVHGIEFMVDSNSIQINDPDVPRVISRRDDGSWDGYYIAAYDGIQRGLNAEEIASLRERYEWIARSSYSLARDLFEVQHYIDNTIIPSDYREMMQALEGVPPLDAFEMVMIDGCRDMLQATTKDGFTYLYGTPLIQITDEHGTIVFLSNHGYVPGGDFVFVMGRNTELSELQGEREYNKDVYTGAQTDELLGRARQLHAVLFRYYAPRAQAEASRFFLMEYNFHRPCD